MAIERFTNDSTTGAYPASGNFGYTNSPFQTYLTRVGIMNNEENLLFARFGTLPTIQQGYLTVQWWRPRRVEDTSVVETTITDVNNPHATNWKVGATGDDTNVPIGTTQAIPRQFILQGTVADMIQQFSLLNFVEAGIAEFGKAAGRHMDKLVQNTIYAAADANSRLSFKANLSSINGYTTSNRTSTQISLTDIATMATVLQERSVQGFPGLNDMYAGIIHTKVKHDLMVSTTANDSILDIYKHTPEQVKKVLKGYVGHVFGVAIFSSPFVQSRKSTGQGTPDVYPCYFLGKDAYGCLKYMMQSYFVGFTASKSDPAAQRSRFALKWVFTCKVLKHENLQVLLVQSSR